MAQRSTDTLKEIPGSTMVKVNGELMATRRQARSVLRHTTTRRYALLLRPTDNCMYITPLTACGDLAPGEARWIRPDKWRVVGTVTYCAAGREREYTSWFSSKTKTSFTTQYDWTEDFTLWSSTQHFPADAYWLMVLRTPDQPQPPTHGAPVSLEKGVSCDTIPRTPVQQSTVQPFPNFARGTPA